MSLDDATRERFAATSGRLAAFGEKRVEGLRSRVVDLLDPLGHEVALDAATGTGPFALALAPLVRRVVGVDSVPEMLEQARRLAGDRANVSFVEGSVYELPLDSASFDIAAIVRTVHHLERPAAALAELTRVLAPGGRLAIIDQLVSEDTRDAELYEKLERMRDRAHVRTLPDSEMRELIVEAGLELTHASIEPEKRNLSVFLDLAGCEEPERGAIFDYARDLIGNGETAGVDLRADDDAIRFTGRVGFYVASRRAT